TDAVSLASDGHAPWMGDIAGRSTRRGIDTVSMRLLGANATARVVGLDPLPITTNYFIGKDRSKWRAWRSSYRRVKDEEIYPDTDLVFYGNQGNLEYDLVLRPGSDPSAIKLRFDGVGAVRIDNGGDLVLEAEFGEIRQHRPLVYQKTGEGM